MKLRKSLAAVTGIFSKGGRSQVLGFVERFNPAIISGWAIHKEGAPLGIALRLNEEKYPLPIKWHERADVAQEYGPQFKLCGFRANLSDEISKAFWEAIHQDQRVEVLANDTGLRVVGGRTRSKVQSLRSPAVQEELRYDYLVDGGKCAFEKQHWADAEALFKQAIQLKPANADVLWLLAQALDKLGRTWEAADVCGKAVALAPGHASRQYTYGTYLERMNRFEAAAEVYRKAVDLEPGRSEWYYRLGYALEKSGLPEQAQLAYLSAIEYDKSGDGRRLGPGIYHARRGYWVEAAAAFEATAESYPDNAELFYRLGMAHDRCYRWDKAVQAYSRAIELDPSQSYWFYRLGFALERQEKWLDAAAAYQNAVERKVGHDGSWYYRLGSVLARADRHEAACKAFQDTRKKKLLAPPSHQDVSLAFLDNRPEYGEYVNELDPRPAVVLYEGAADKSFESPLYRKFENDCQADELKHLTHVWVLADKIQPPMQACSGKNVLFVTMGSDLHLRYLATAGEVLLGDSLPLEGETYRNSAQRLFKVGRFLEQCQRWGLAAEAYRAGLERDSVEADWHWRLAIVLERAGKWAEAEEAYRAAVARKDKHDDYWYFRLAYVLDQQGRYEDACDVYRWTRVLGRPYGVETQGYLKDKGFSVAAEYTEYFEQLPLLDKTVVYESYHGASISCNPLAIFRYLLDNPRYAGWTHIWVLKDKQRIPEEYRWRSNVIFVTRGSSLYLRYLASAKFLVNNVSFPEYFIRRPEQVYLNTWHGTPLKSLGKDIKSPFLDHKNVARNFLHATHLISPNEHTTYALLDRYDVKGIFPGRLLESGYPRIDLTLNATDERKDALRERLGIAQGKTVVLYAPTWRGTSTEKRFDDTRLLKDIESLSKMDCALLFRGHHLVEGLLASKMQHIRVVPEEIDTNELLSIIDILITDYSSIFYDFLVTGRPILHYAYDYEEYVAERGVYFPQEEWPGEICRSRIELQHALGRLLGKSYFGIFQPKPREQSDVYRSARDKFTCHEDGRATARVVEFFIEGRDSGSKAVNTESKALLFFEGPFIPNGISTSFVSLMNNLDLSRFIPVVAVEPGGVASESERLAELEKLPADARILGRTGRTSATPEEQWLIDKFNSQNDLVSTEQWRVMGNAYRREFARMFGYANFRAVVNFEGYSKLWSAIFAFAPEATRKLIYQHNNMHGEWQVRFPYLKGVFNLYPFYDRMISVSKNTRDLNVEHLSKALQLREEAFDYCVNPIMPERVRALAQVPIDSAAHPWFDDKGVVTFINMGRLSPEKDQGKLIDAFEPVHQAHPNTQLLILGDGPLRHEVELKIERAGLRDSVRLLGAQSNPFPFLSRADCFVLSSNHEGQPMVLLESLILGKPVVATDIPGSRSVLDDGYGVLVENSAAGLAEGMSAFVDGKLSFKPFDAEAYVNEAMAMFYTRVCGEPQRKRPLNIAHRGGSGLRPENTLAAFAHAIDLGVDAAELDVHLTKDGHVVVHHNAALDHNLVRKPNGEWLGKDERVVISEHTLEELRQYEVGLPNPATAYRARFPDLVAVEGERIALLSEVIALAKAKSHTFKLIIEFKSDETNAAAKPWRALVERTIEVIAEHGFQSRAIFCAFDWGALRYAKELNPHISTWYTTHPMSWLAPGDVPREDLSPSKKRLEKLRAMMASGDAPWYAGFDPRSYGSYPAAVSAAGGNAWFVYHTDVIPEAVDNAHGHGISVAVWSSGLRDDNRITTIRRSGVDAICTDFPNVLV